MGSVKYVVASGPAPPIKNVKVYNELVPDYNWHRGAGRTAVAQTAKTTSPQKYAQLQQHAMRLLAEQQNRSPQKSSHARVNYVNASGHLPQQQQPHYAGMYNANPNVYGYNQMIPQRHPKQPYKSPLQPRVHRYM